MTLNPPLPPSVPTDAALLGAFNLLQSLGNAQNTAAILGQMAEHKKAIDEATVANNAAAAAATQAQTELADLQERERVVTAREEAVASAQTALAVASSAIADRDAAVKAKEAESDKREADIAKRIAELDRRVESHRAALAG
jgi:hypothetical protein